MKKIATFAVAAIACAAFGISAQAANSIKKAPSYDAVTCDELTGLRYEDVGPFVYYVAGHYDAKHDIWTDYGANSKTVTADTFNIRLPVEDIYAYCSANPKDTVVNAINKHKK